MSEEIPMYCCLYFSDAVHYGLITIDTERIEVDIRLRSSLLNSEKKELKTKLIEEHNTHMDADHFFIIHCPWCGVHLSTVIDYDRGAHAGQYSSKEGWEK